MARSNALRAPEPDESVDVEALLGPKWASLEWRLDNLYWIVNKAGKRVRFRMNDDQRAFVRALHTRNVVVKSRQRGFSTLMQILQLDQALFVENHNGVTISDTLPNANKLFAKAEFALKNLDEDLQAAFPIKTRTAKTGIDFEHDSSVYVSTSSRGGTVRLLHVSELGPIARKYPLRAEEIVTGAFESVPLDGIIVIESTTQGASGEFYDIAWAAYQAQLAGEPETALSWRLHFFPWFTDTDCQLVPEEAATVVIPDSLALYFRKLQADLDITLTHEQMAWYVVKKRTLGIKMKGEYPATVEEAFEAAIEGAIFAEQMSLVREQHRIGEVPLDPNYPVHTFWDFGTGNRTVVWAMQRILLQNRWVKCFEADGTGLGPLWRRMEEWRKSTGEWTWGTHHLPHDADTTRLGEGVDTYRGILDKAGMRNIAVVPRVHDKGTAIELMRQKLPVDNWFDRSGCADGIKAVDNYQFEWSDKLGTWSNQPLGNWASHFTDAWMQYAQGFVGSVETRDRSIESFKRRARRGV
jgi:hypothetical protein